MVSSSLRRASGIPAVTGVTQAELMALHKPRKVQHFIEEGDGDVPIAETHTISI